MATSKPTRGPIRNPYLDKFGAPLLLDSVVLVIDELGATSRMVSNLTTDVIAQRADLLARAREWLGEVRTDELESVIVYTDNLVHGAPFADQEDAVSRLGLTISAASHYQLELAVSGTILRGGIAIGQHHQSPAIVAGPALIEAHLREMNGADVPRVVLSSGAFDLVKAGLPEWFPQSESPWVSQLLVDEDGHTFVSYLSASEDHDRGRLDQEVVLRRHRDQVLDGLEATKDLHGPLKKWQWLAAYHDHYIELNTLPDELSVGSDSHRNFASIPFA